VKLLNISPDGTNVDNSNKKSKTVTLLG